MNQRSELAFPDWQAPLEEVILEFDLEKLADKAVKVEALILERLKQLQQTNDGLNERAAIMHGLSVLRVIKVNRLGYCTAR